MGAPPASVREFWGRCAADPVYDEFVRQAVQDGVMTGGHHHRTYVLPLSEPMAARLGRAPGGPVVVRVRRTDALPLVVRTWEREPELLRAVGRVVPGVPEVLADRGRSAVHSFAAGVPLSARIPYGEPVPAPRIRQLTGFLAGLTRVRREQLPPLPSAWPRSDRDGQGFLRTLARTADRSVRQPNWASFGGLFVMLGVPEGALADFAARVPVLARRPYGLLHGDLHRDNVIVPDDVIVPDTAAAAPPSWLDWELATYGDPLHDLAVHLVRMRYPQRQWAEVVGAWADAMTAVRPAAVHGLARDLRHYVAFERAQSVFPDVVRAAVSLTESWDEAGLAAATAAVRRSLAGAEEPLRLPRVPDTAEIERALLRWQRARHGRSGPGGAAARTGEWQPDDRVPEDPSFPRHLVSRALVAEAQAPAERVFQGTAHLNTVVSVPGAAFPVVVRRRVAAAVRRERALGFLSEHSVLDAIERADAAVRAPRVLALGVSHGDRFAIHTYVGPADPGQRPGHPVHGLLPHEADDLVDQLCALTGVDCRRLDPAAGDLPFFHWLTEQLVAIVAGLPDRTQQTARLFGLPDARRLHEILSRHRMTARAPSLLHGDLNPWNLVRGERPGSALTVIDWEMAMVGDPLYDLVRHMHLTPTRPEIRDRMFRRWERNVPSDCSRDWERDWRIYRRLETIRSAYVDLDRLVTGVGLDAPNVRRAVDSYAMTLSAATACLGLSARAPSGPALPLPPGRPTTR
ncbi:phosphotransferase family protein [Streptomyces poriticola]|uniref:phosphotransferase family protein n=1 Tax=Streptomyces poriticola TaxID=3120506 RepID=UPI002FCE1D5F